MNDWYVDEIERLRKQINYLEERVEHWRKRAEIAEHLLNEKLFDGQGPNDLDERGSNNQTT